MNGLIIRLEESTLGNSGTAVLQRLKDILVENRGDLPVVLKIEAVDGKSTNVLLDRQFWVGLSDEALGALEDAAGWGNVFIEEGLPDSADAPF